jgi:copper homeostasis protein
MKYILEIATSDFVTTRSAVEGGADRIELCANLQEGGTTPSRGHLVKCRETFDVELFPIIRPRGGDFLYSKDEFGIMAADIAFCKEIGCEGIVVGLLNIDGTIDMIRTGDLVEEAYPMEVSFHRAFDRCKDPFAALEELVEIGCQRILTSGQQPTAPEGIDLIAALNKAADGRIIIMPGSGVRKENIREIAEKTGCTEFHSSLRGKDKSKMKFIHPSFADSPDSYMNNAIDPREVIVLRQSLATLEPQSHEDTK